MATHVELVDTTAAPAETLEALHELYLTSDQELLPEDPPVSLARRLVDWRHLIATEAIPRWVLWKGPEVVASSSLFMDLEQNLENGWGWVYVHPHHRGSGHGREVARPMLDAAEKAGRARFGTWVHDGRPEEVLMRRSGLKQVYRSRMSRLSFQDIDWELMESWVARAEERASDYELLYLPSPLDDRHLEAFCDLVFVMNTAPQENLEEEDAITTPEMWRDIEAKVELRSQDLLTYVARHKPTGRFVGYTNVAHHRLQPDLVRQWDTGVDPDHRNKGIGRWVKAAMALKLRDLYPDVQRIDTDNAGSNEPMLGINDEMGFEPVYVENVWQGELATLRKNLRV